MDGAHLRTQRLAGAPTSAGLCTARAVSLLCPTLYTQTLILGLFCANEKFMFIPDAFRQCYEAYTIYSFYRYIVCYIEDREGLPLADVMAQQPPMKHLIPLRMPWYSAQRGWHDLYTLRPWRMGREFLWHCETGIHNYVIGARAFPWGVLHALLFITDAPNLPTPVKPLTTAVTLVCVFTNTYGANTFRADVAYPYLAAADSLSQAWALYCLVLVYLQTHNVLASAQPTLKFLCVKGVVFATFWQGLLLSLLSFFHVFRGLQDTWSTSCHFKQEVVVDALQDVLICVEMLVFAVLHAVAFPSREYRDANLPRRAAAARLKHLFDVSDVYQDVTRHAETVAGTIAGRAAAAAGGVLQAAEDAMAHMAGSVKGNGGVGRGSGGAWAVGNRAQGADLQKPLLDGASSHACAFAWVSTCPDAFLAPFTTTAEFEEGDLLDAPWLDAGQQQPPRLPLPPLPSARPESRASQATSDAGMGPDLL